MFLLSIFYLPRSAENGDGNQCQSGDDEEDRVGFAAGVGKVNGWDAIHGADVPEREVNDFKGFARAAPCT